MNSWNNVRIKDVAKIYAGATPASQNINFWEGDIPWISPADMSDFGFISHGDNFITQEGYLSCGTNLVPNNSVIVSTRAPIGKINIAVNALCTNQGCKSLVPYNIDSAFLAYYLHNEKENLASLGQGTTFRELSLKNLASFSIQLPPLDTQRRIVAFLDEKTSAIDRKIENLQKQLDAYSRLKNSIIHTAVTRGLDPNVPLKDSGIDWIGKIPAHWRTERLKQMHKGSNTGLSIDKDYWSDNKNDTVFYTAGLKPIYTNYKNFTSKLLTGKNDLLLARNGTPYVYNPICGAIYTDHIIRIYIKKNYCKTYVSYCLPLSIKNEVVDTVSITTWSISIWNRQILPTPPLPEQKKIVEYLDRKCTKIDVMVNNIMQQIDAHKRLKRALINETVTGQRAV